MRDSILEQLAREQIAKRFPSPRAVPRRRRRTTLAERLRSTDTRPTN